MPSFTKPVPTMPSAAPKKRTRAKQTKTPQEERAARVERLRAQVQDVLDRFAARKMDLNYEQVIGVAARMVLTTYQQQGVLDADDVAERGLGAQLSILTQEFAARCVERDEQALVAPRARAPRSDRATQVARQVMMQRPRVIRSVKPPEPAPPTETPV